MPGLPAAAGTGALYEGRVRSGEIGMARAGPHPDATDTLAATTWSAPPSRRT